jgi:MFS family permease
VVPIVLFALVGGLLADARDRRQVMIGTRIAAGIVAAILALMTLTDQITVGAIYLLTAAGAAAAVFDAPARQAILPNLVERKDLTNAITLNMLTFQVATIIGPALAGVLVAQFNIGVVYAINALTFGVAVVTVWLLHHRSQTVVRTNSMGRGALLDGLRFVYRSPMIWSTMLLDFFATFFASARTLLPIVAADILGVGAGGYGLLATAEPVGSLIAGSVVALRKDIYHQGVVLLVSVTVYGLAIALFGLSTGFILSYVLFALTGAGDTVSSVIRGTIRQIMTPDQLRGRTVSVNMIFFMGGPQLGELEAGLVAAALGAPFAIFTGGVAVVLLTGWIAWKYPRLRNYTSDQSSEILATQAAD